MSKRPLPTDTSGLAVSVTGATSALDSTEKKSKIDLSSQQSNAQQRVRNLVGGQWQDAVKKGTLENRNPATQELLALIPSSTAEDVEEAVSASKAGFAAWSKVPASKRADALDAIADAIEANAAYLSTLESKDSGKPLSLASVMDIPRSAMNFRFFAGALRHDEVQSTHMDAAMNYTQRMPVGVCGLITPWNLPLYLLSWKVAPALAMGNAVICKPSEVTPMTADALAAIISQIPEIPAGTFNMLHGLGQHVGQALTAHPDVQLISFTGGTLTGRRVAATAAPLFKKLSLELGGKNSTVVFDDCDFDKAVLGAFRAAFTNQGQVCLSGSRLFLQKGIYKRFLDALVAKTKEVVVGDPLTSNFGSLSSIAHRDKVRSYVEHAKASGGVILCGNDMPQLPSPFDKGAFFPPTIITGLPYDSKCSQEEIFGPVLTVHSFDTEAEVASMVNSVKYGLAGSVWTSNLGVAHRVAHNIDSGMIWVNCWLLRDLRVPFGGVKESGTGREGGTHSLEFYSESKNICIKYD